MARRRILIVEDNALVARAIEIMLEEIGYQVAGPAPTSEAAQQLIERKAPDAALLDLYLGEGTSEDLAGRLVEARIPFAFLTGEIGPLPASFRDTPVLSKPIDRALLVETLARMCGDGGA